jgi:hypothetical protein
MAQPNEINYYFKAIKRRRALHSEDEEEEDIDSSPSTKIRRLANKAFIASPAASPAKTCSNVTPLVCRPKPTREQLLNGPSGRKLFFKKRACRPAPLSPICSHRQLPTHQLNHKRVIGHVEGEEGAQGRHAITFGVQIVLIVLLPLS